MDQSRSCTTLTMRELDALKKHEYNLTDAHPRYEPISRQGEAIEALGLKPLFNTVHTIPYQNLVQNFAEAFYSLGGQYTAIHINRDAMLCYSASLGIQIIASFIRSKGLKVALLE